MAFLQSRKIDIMQPSICLGLFLGSIFFFLPCVLLAQVVDEPAGKIKSLKGLHLNAGNVDLFTCKSEVEIAIGELWCGTRYELELSLSNTGSTSIKIEEVLSSCGCFNGSSESNVIDAGKSVMQRVSMVVSEGTTFSQQLEFKSSNFAEAKKLKFVAKTRSRASFSPSPFRLQSINPTEVSCTPESERMLDTLQ